MNVKTWIKQNEVNPETISVLNGEGESSYGRCDITGEQADVFQCSALTLDGHAFEFDACERVAMILARISGAV